MSDGIKGVMKNGWHPKGKDGGKESWRGDFKGINQVAGWVGKGKTSETQAARDHVSRPLATLKDPALFGPPPKNVNYHGGAALPNEITPHRSGLGAPLSQTEVSTAREQLVEEEEPAKPPPPALPYRMNTTGQRVDQFAPPPSAARRDVPPPPPARSSAPAPPPRLPARSNTLPSPVAEAPPPAYEPPVSQPSSNSWLNQKSASSLSKAGISVPALGIGGSQQDSNPWKEEKSQTSGRGQLSELQSRFAKMNTRTPETATSPHEQPQAQAQTQSPSQTGLPSWQQSQSAFKTAQTMRTNPQNVTLADAQNAAQTANQTKQSVNAFREKHADSIASAQTKAKAWDQKYKVTSKLNKFLDEHEAPQQQEPTPAQPAGQASAYDRPPPVLPQQPTSSQPVPSSTPVIDMSATSISRKPPPPPAPRKPANLQAPPPVPTGTKPNFA